LASRSWTTSSARTLREIASFDTKWPTPQGVTYSILGRYDVLIVVPRGGTITPEEVDAIKEYVNDGGGLLFLADSYLWDTTIPAAFDVTFLREGIYDRGAEQFKSLYQFYVSDITQHPITENVEQIALDNGYPITSYSKGDILVRTSGTSYIRGVGRGPFNILLGIKDIGKGRAVFFDLSSFSNWVTEEPHQQNIKLLTNAVAWLGEPGGPYRVYISLNEEAHKSLEDARSLYEAHDFSQAISTFKEAIRIFGESSELYSNSEAFDGIEEATTGIALCDTGIKADQAFCNAESLFADRNYEEAITEFEEAKLLYEKIEYTERVEECTRYIDNSHTWIALREEATELPNEAEKTLGKADGTFRTADFIEARSLFEKARTAWEEYDDPGKVAACEEKITMCTAEIARINRNRLIVTGVIICSLGVIVQVVRHRQLKHKETKMKP